MKKLMTNVCGKLIIASVALAGLFSSCVEEGTVTSFDVKEAVANITIKVVEQGSGVDLTSASTITYTQGAYTLEQGASAGKYTMKGNKAIEATAVNFKAVWKDKYNRPFEGSCTVDIPTILAGGNGDFEGIIIIETKFEPASDFTFTFVQETGSSVTKIGSLQQATHEYMGNTWAANDSPYLLSGTATYDVLAGTYVKNVTYATGATTEDKAYVDSFKAGIPAAAAKSKGEFEFKVSAYAYYNVFVTRIYTPTSYKCSKTNKVTKETSAIGTVVLESVGSSVDYREVAMPNHAEHYHYGHGHDAHGHDAHGQSGNAGGGIIFAE